MSKVIASAYKKSIYDIGLPREQEAVIWNFYVTKSIVGSAAQRRTISEYGWRNILFKEMLNSAGTLDENVKILPTSSINDTLKKYDLDTGKVNDEKEIEIDEQKIVCLTPFTIADENPPKAKVAMQNVF